MNTTKLRKNLLLIYKKMSWSMKYKKSINCIIPKGFSQRQYCKYGRKNKTKTKKNNGGRTRKNSKR